jgi:hypothetical protein
MTDYPWPRYVTQSKEHLYVLGVISLNFNLYEFSLIVFLEEHFDKEVAAFLTDKLSNEERAHLIRLIMSKDKYLDHAMQEEVEFILRHFATCAENRHTLLHARPAIPSLATFGHSEKLLELEKFKRGDPGTVLTFRLEIGDLRRTADEMRAGFDFMLDLWRYLFDRQHYYTVLQRSEESGLSPDAVVASLAYPTLPKRPPAPRKIDPRPIYEVQ